MKSEKSYFNSAYSINMTNVNIKEVEWGINFTYRDKNFILIKPTFKSDCYILHGNFVIGKVDLRYPENIFIYIMLKECDNKLENGIDTVIKIINPDVSIFKKVSFEDIFIRLRKNKINMVKIINAK